MSIQAAALALLRQFSPNLPDKQAAVDSALAELEDNLTPIIRADVNDGQMAALIDYVIVSGLDDFNLSQLRHLIMIGNMTLAYDELGDGQRGAARKTVWCIGNSQ